MHSYLSHFDDYFYIFRAITLFQIIKKIPQSPLIYNNVKSVMIKIKSLIILKLQKYSIILKQKFNTNSKSNSFNQYNVTNSMTIKYLAVNYIKMENFHLNMEHLHLNVYFYKSLLAI